MEYHTFDNHELNNIKELIILSRSKLREDPTTDNLLIYYSLELALIKIESAKKDYK